ncbi:lipopolysaccharide transport periplasmic protein LptA [Candidatus Vallotia cooleyia]|uniref:lipopolysaccharide transport periplasmic protein LptA n=1 Tax=Candidatus Vallotiella adelgis TaxID=1177211 RepID=UPI002A4E1582|nr:lipopolysaccharide transport periplasmic protein LptA [Candidatus Vallotia cooleyia]
MLLLAAAIPLIFFLPIAYAERADRDKPLHIEADNMTYNDLKKLTIFTGHVIATKGTILIRADCAKIRQDPQGYRHFMGSSNGITLPYFRQKRDGIDEYIEGNAVRINYDGKRDLTTLSMRAVVRRLHGLSKVIDEVRGNVLTFDGQKDFYTARSGRDITGPDNPSGRVRAMLTSDTGQALTQLDSAVKLAPSTMLHRASQP